VNERREKERAYEKKEKEDVKRKTKKQVIFYGKRE
jgi:hypothetical protein